MDRQLSVLLLTSKDPFDLLIRRACRIEGFVVNFVAEDDFGFNDGTDKGLVEPPRGYAEALRKVLEEKSFDAIVVQNNRGAGIAKVRLIPEELRKKTIVMWTTANKEDQMVYTQELGITRFTEIVPEIRKLCEILKEFLPADGAPVE